MSAIISGSAADGIVYATDGISWNNVHDATTGTADDDDSFETVAIRSGCITAKGVTTYLVSRAFINFDTFRISATPSAATLYVYGYTNGTGDVIAVSGSQATGDGYSALGSGDFDSFENSGAGWDGDTPTATGYTTQPYTDAETTWSTSGYNSMTINSVGLADMARLDDFKICLMNYDYDWKDVSPGTGTCVDHKNGMRFGENTGYEPYIQWTGYGNTVGGIIAANIDSIKGVQTGNISEVIGT